MTDWLSSAPAERMAGVTGTRSARMRLPAASPAPPLRPWSRIWRYLLAVGIGFALWFGVIVAYGGQNPDGFSAAEFAVIRGFLILDLVVGVAAIAVVPLRRRRPVIAATVLVGLTSVSSFVAGSAVLSIVSMSTRRRWRSVVALGFLWVGCTLFYEFVLRPSVPGATSSAAFTWASSGLAVAVYAVCASTGFYIGARRELLASLRERAENAESEQALREKSARQSERTRIAREMHDVLAHRISLVSLHAGALTYRTDLTRDEASEAAAVIQNNAQLALNELRQILGVLRSNSGGDEIEPPQPTLAELPALFADSREAGMHVTLDAAELALDGLSESVSRTAYRIIQEALTNARKHAFGSAVTLVLEKREEELRIVVRNPLRRSSTPVTNIRGSGAGLMGLEERAQLSGGTLAHGVDRGDRFVVTVRLPWK